MLQYIQVRLERRNPYANVFRERQRSRKRTFDRRGRNLVSLNAVVCTKGDGGGGGDNEAA